MSEMGEQARQRVSRVACRGGLLRAESAMALAEVSERGTPGQFFRLPLAALRALPSTWHRNSVHGSRPQLCHGEDRQDVWKSRDLGQGHQTDGSQKDQPARMA